MNLRCWSLLVILLLSSSSVSSNVFAKEGSAKKGSSKKSSAMSPDGFVSLINDKNLDNWIKRGGNADYHVEGNMIVGTTKANTPNTFLCTPRNYANFILEVELNADPKLNSGVQIRSECFDEPKTITYEDANGKTVSKKIPAGRVHGYQVEIDHRPERRWSGGIYDEARRGWINNLEGEENKAAREAYKFGEWNKYRIEAKGDSIKTWVNGVPAADLKDGLTPEGFIALQVHGIYNPDEVGLNVRWRNVRIKELP